MQLLSRFKRLTIIVLCLLAAGFASGCGGGGGGGFSIAPQNSRAFDPNYVSELKSLTHWNTFPVKVYFALDGEFTTERQALATAGFEQWNGATDAQIHFAVTQDAAQAQLTVHFVPALDDKLIGWTNWSYDGGGAIQHADTKIAVTGLSAADTTWIAAHEFGHALGLDGHSGKPDDLMFASHVLRSDWHLTVRDENTVKTGYGWLFGIGAVPAGSRSSGPLKSIEVRCYVP